MGVDIDRVLDARPMWAERVRQRVRDRIRSDEVARRRAIAATVVMWQLGEMVAPRRQVAPIRRLLLAMVVFDSVATYVWVSNGLAIEGNPLVAAAMDAMGDGLGLAVRTLWAGGLVLVLTWLADRRAAVRPALVPVLLGLGAVSVLHVLGLAWVWTTLT